MPGIPHPVLFVHGFDGTPADWTDDGFPQFLVREGGFDPDLIRLFYFGLDDEGDYNNRGDIRQIASRLMDPATERPEDVASSLTQLSHDSVAAGGPAQVDIVAHSLGGLVARYYLSRRISDEHGTVYLGSVGRLITIGTPHLGLDLARWVNLIPAEAWLWRPLRWLERLPCLWKDPAEQLQEADDAVHNWQQRARRAAFREMGTRAVDRLDSPALRQMQPGSAFLKTINAPGAMPREVRYHVFYGDIRFRLRVLIQRILPMYQRIVSFGDLLVPAESARTIPNAVVSAHGLVHEREIVIALSRSLDGLTRALDELPACYHGKLRRNPAVQARVLSILTD